MRREFRVTRPLVDVVGALRDAKGEARHGWALAEQTGQSGPNVYRALERLRRAGWVVCWWEDENPDPTKPRRKFCKLTDKGESEAPGLLAEHRRPRGNGIQTPLLGLVAVISLFNLFGGDA